MAAGADVLDVGGESTRPGASEVDSELEKDRILPVIEGLSGTVPISIDTTKAAVAEVAISAGAEIVNDVSALRGDPEMAALCAEKDVDLILMHMLGSPRTMQDDPTYGDVVSEVREFLLARAQSAIEQGVARERIWLDPGIGFGKTLEHNLSLLAATCRFRETGFPVLIGPSRKAFIGKIDGSDRDQRLGGTIAACLAARSGGASMVRVHDVEEVVQAIRIQGQIEAHGE